MGSAEEATPSAKPPKATTTTTTPPSAPAGTKKAVLEPSVSLPAAPPAYSTTDWAAPVHAYYAGGAPAPPSFYSSPPVWGSQHIPYGTPIPYPPMYHHHPAVYAHPSIAPTVYPMAESGGNKLEGGSGGGSGKSGGGGGRGKVTSGSAEDYGSESGGESGSEGTSGTRDDSAVPQDISRKRLFGDTLAEGENSQPIAGNQNNGATADSSYTGRARTVSKLPVSAPGRAALPSPPPNSNMGMDIWNASQVGSLSAKGRTNAIVPVTVVANGVMPERHWDEREQKRERRKQSNRESARRSRLRKQQECEDLAKKVSELDSENGALKLELEQLNKVCKELEKENASIAEELSRMSKTGVASEIEAITYDSLSNGPLVGREES